MKPLSKNTTSTEYTGNQTFASNSNRSYFFIIFTEGAGTVEFGEGGGEIPLPDNTHYEPAVAPTGEIKVRTTGTYIVHMG